MILAEISDVTWQALIAAIVTITLAWMQHQSNKKLDALKKVTDDTHTLSNSNMGIQLRLNASLSREKANKTHNPIDIEAADLAESEFAEHEAKQDIVDKRNAND